MPRGSMLAALRRLFAPPPAALPPPDPTAPWRDALLELVQKTARAQSKLALSLENVDQKLEGGLSELRGSIAALSLPSAARTLDFTDLLDALDLLDEAARSSAEPGLREGLERISSRLEGFLERQGVRRVCREGVPADGKLFRVVGTRLEPEQPEGLIAQVVRAAVFQGDQLIREGEVLTTRRGT